MIERTFDPSFLNSVANHEAVRPYLEGEGAIDLSQVAANADNFLLQCERGGFVLIRHEPGRFEVHSLFLPDGGSAPIKAMLEAQEWMFTRSECEAITSKVPDTNERAKGFAIAGGLKERFRGKAASFVELTMLEWALRTKKCRAEGERFHDFLEAAKAANGSALEVHDDDAVHDHVVGAASLMMKRGRPEKAVTLYNRWARQTGFAPIEILQLAPLVIDVVDAVLGLEDQEMRVLLCR